ncbi:hypothetical protein KOW79_018984 [Hemibagrus wyckioides]|uniref:Uncharacterized protein n=1 Tax=Hemibagrus wyckioides TaxID=337641 RepID=A0A9D3N8P4_9TELE|nr:hypothetical protein KOW79_018984 [Hemibagrus wyckioides]
MHHGGFNGHRGRLRARHCQEGPRSANRLKRSTVPRSGRSGDASMSKHLNHKKPTVLPSEAGGQLHVLRGYEAQASRGLARSSVIRLSLGECTVTQNSPSVECVSNPATAPGAIGPMPGAADWPSRSAFALGLSQLKETLGACPDTQRAEPWNARKSVSFGFIWTGVDKQRWASPLRIAASHPVKAPVPQAGTSEAEFLDTDTGHCHTDTGCYSSTAIPHHAQCPRLSLGSDAGCQTLTRTVLSVKTQVEHGCSERINLAAGREQRRRREESVRVIKRSHAARVKIKLYSSLAASTPCLSPS